jgi:hypothetical protein
LFCLSIKTNLFSQMHSVQKAPSWILTHLKRPKR